VCIVFKRSHTLTVDILILLKLMDRYMEIPYGPYCDNATPWWNGPVLPPALHNGVTLVQHAEFANTVHDRWYRDTDGSRQRGLCFNLTLVRAID
jgi:hypothetical protein